jgi:heme-binding NEAT domain protein
MARNVRIAAVVMIALVAPIDAFAAEAPAPAGATAPGTTAPSASMTPTAPVNPSVTAPNADAGTPQAIVPPTGVAAPAN